MARSQQLSHSSPANVIAASRYIDSYEISLGASTGSNTQLHKQTCRRYGPTCCPGSRTTRSSCSASRSRFRIEPTLEGSLSPPPFLLRSRHRMPFVIPPLWSLPVVSSGPQEPSAMPNCRFCIFRGMPYTDGDGQFSIKGCKKSRIGWTNLFLDLCL